LRKIVSAVLAALLLLALGACGAGESAEQTNERVYSASGAYYQDGWMYYYDKAWEYLDDYGDLVRTRDGVTESVIPLNELVDDVGEFIVAGEWLYCKLKGSGNSISFYKMHTDGSGKQKIIDIPYNAGGIRVQGDWLYYLEKGQLYRCRLNGKNKQLLVKKDNTVSSYMEGVYTYKIDGGQIYYQYGANDASLWVMSLNGSQKKLLAPLIYRLVNAKDGLAVYIAHKSDDLRIVSADGTRDRLLMEMKQEYSYIQIEPGYMENDWIYLMKRLCINNDDRRLAIDKTTYIRVRTDHLSENGLSLDSPSVQDSGVENEFPWWVINNDDNGKPYLSDIRYTTLNSLESFFPQ